MQVRDLVEQRQIQIIHRGDDGTIHGLQNGSRTEIKAEMDGSETHKKKKGGRKGM